MLFKYKKVYEKIAMGLLSFMPESKEIKVLQHMIKQYETEENWFLYLWKEEDDFVGVVGIIVVDNTLLVQHLSVNPSHRNQGIATRMIESICNSYKECSMEATELTKPFIDTISLSKA